ncbi:glutathione S-transferase family protein [Thalassococcus lentus]|uniref:Metaxin glutathione S-transferase domain-containing protein n=1 Tax=Thalassococcus lentus TaxID=1210524 RepID=A0ABT4XPB5_9RHOB|nr:hypothetical protein [Thalassococcus lentus]MDA7423791.1 hypothetical protein [Thalassococcus lentus]
MRRQVRQGLVSHGFGRLPADERLKWFGSDLDAIAGQPGDQAFLFGLVPCAVAACVMPFLSVLDRLPSDTQLRRAVRSNARLMAYVARRRAAL